MPPIKKVITGNWLVDLKTNENGPAVAGVAPNFLISASISAFGSNIKVVSVSAIASQLF